MIGKFGVAGHVLRERVHLRPFLPKPAAAAKYRAKKKDARPLGSCIMHKEKAPCYLAEGAALSFCAFVISASIWAFWAGVMFGFSKAFCQWARAFGMSFR